MGMSGSVVHFLFVPIPLSKPEEVTFMEKQEIECQNDVWLFTLAQFQIVVWIPYVFWCQTWKGYCVSLLLGTELKSPLYLIWGRNGQIIFRAIWMRFGPSFSLKTDEWINADTLTSAQEMCLATSLEQVSLVVHHRTLGSPHHRTEGRGGGGQNEWRALRGTVDVCCLRTFNSSHNSDAIQGLKPNKSQSKLCDF